MMLLVLTQILLLGKKEICYGRKVGNDLSSPETISSIDIEEYLYKIHDSEPYVKIYFGNAKLEMRMVLDTVTSQILIPSLECENCIATDNVYVSESSITLDKSDTLLNLTYRNYQLKAYLLKETFYIDNYEIFKLPIYFIISSNEPLIFTYDGILGLGIGSNNIVSSLKSYRKIISSYFSISLSNYYLSDIKPTLTFGNISSLNQINTTDVSFSLAKNSSKWEIFISNLTMEDNNFEYSNTVELDIKNPNIEVPYNIVSKMIALVKDIDTSCNMKKGQLKCNLEEKQFRNIPDLVFYSGNDKFYIRPMHYVQYFKDDGCYTFMLVGSKSDKIIMGRPFFRDHVISFNQDKMEIEIYRNSFYPDLDESKTHLMIIYVITGFVSIVILGIFIYYRKRNHELEQNSRHGYYIFKADDNEYHR